MRVFWNCSTPRLKGDPLAAPVSGVSVRGKVGASEVDVPDELRGTS